MASRGLHVSCPEPPVPHMAGNTLTLYLTCDHTFHPYIFRRGEGGHDTFYLSDQANCYMCGLKFNLCTLVKNRVHSGAGKLGKSWSFIVQCSSDMSEPKYTRNARQPNTGIRIGTCELTS